MIQSDQSPSAHKVNVTKKNLKIRRSGHIHGSNFFTASFFCTLSQVLCAASGPSRPGSTRPDPTRPDQPAGPGHIQGRSALSLCPPPRKALEMELQFPCEETGDVALQLEGRCGGEAVRGRRQERVGSGQEGGLQAGGAAGQPQQQAPRAATESE